MCVRVCVCVCVHVYLHASMNYFHIADKDLLPDDGVFRSLVFGSTSCKAGPDIRCVRGNRNANLHAQRRGQSDAEDPHMVKSVTSTESLLIHTTNDFCD